jgi:hypothetical protein
MDWLYLLEKAGQRLQTQAPAGGQLKAIACELAYETYHWPVVWSVTDHPGTLGGDVNVGAVPIMS